MSKLNEHLEWQDLEEPKEPRVEYDPDWEMCDECSEMASVWPCDGFEGACPKGKWLCKKCHVKSEWASGWCEACSDKFTKAMEDHHEGLRDAPVSAGECHLCKKDVHAPEGLATWCSSCLHATCSKCHVGGTCKDCLP